VGVGEGGMGVGVGVEVGGKGVSVGGGRVAVGGSGVLVGTAVGATVVGAEQALRRTRVMIKVSKRSLPWLNLSIAITSVNFGLTGPIVQLFPDKNRSNFPI